MKRYISYIGIIVMLSLSLAAFCGCAREELKEEKFTFQAAPWGASWEEVQKVTGLRGTESASRLGAVTVENVSYMGVSVNAGLLFDVNKDSTTPGLCNVVISFQEADQEKLLAAMETVYGERKTGFTDKNGVENPISPSGWFTEETLETSLSEDGIDQVKAWYRETHSVQTDADASRLDAVLRQPLVMITFDEEENRVVFSGSTAACVTYFKQLGANE